MKAKLFGLSSRIKNTGHVNRLEKHSNNVQKTKLSEAKVLEGVERKRCKHSILNKKEEFKNIYDI